MSSIALRPRKRFSLRTYMEDGDWYNLILLWRIISPLGGRERKSESVVVLFDSGLARAFHALSTHGIYPVSCVSQFGFAGYRGERNERGTSESYRPVNPRRGHLSTYTYRSCVFSLYAGRCWLVRIGVSAMWCRKCCRPSRTATNPTMKLTSTSSPFFRSFHTFSRSSKRRVALLHYNFMSFFSFFLLLCIHFKWKNGMENGSSVSFTPLCYHLYFILCGRFFFIMHVVSSLLVCCP